MRTLCFFFVLFFFVCVQAAHDRFKVEKVPGFDGKIPFDQYAGYLSANDGKKQLFFWFVQSQNKPSEDPVVLWLNGGPGCSSFDGFVYEHGPFKFSDGPMGPKQNLTLNPYSWNKAANMIYLDSPAGVGLSYSTDKKDYVTNDTTTAIDSHHFLLNFFKEFSEFRTNEFYISGESYAGIYVPTLAQQVVKGNNDPNTFINIKGILVGNGVTSDYFDGNAFVPFVHGHGLIDNNLFKQLVQSCNSEFWNATGKCEQLLEASTKLVQDLNIYNIYDKCFGLGPHKQYTSVHKLWDRVKRIRDSQENPEETVPCIDSKRAREWINQDDLRKQIHALSVKEKKWTICTDEIDYSRVYDSVIPIHKYLLDNKLRILIYSGDTDMCVPFTGSEAWTSSLNLTVVADWRPWFVEYQVAGYVRQYKQLTFATILGAGHTVPEYKPKQALYFFENFLIDKPF